MRTFFMALAVTALSGCVTYGDWVGSMEQQIATHDLQGALNTLKHSAGRHDRDQVLYDLNRGMLLRMQGEYAQSSTLFEQAKAEADRLDAVSVTEQAGAFAVNDLMRSYVGEYFERVFLHVYGALNYLDMARPADARVEILQLDVLMGRERTRFSGDAFALYLSGMIFESLGQWDDAMIAYRKADEAYRSYGTALGVELPRYLKQDLVRAAERVGGLADELQRYRTEFDLPTGVPGPQDGAGEVIFLLHSGLIPVKRDNLVGMAAPDGKLIAISMPYYEERTPYVTGARLSSGTSEADTVLAEDLDAVAADTLEREKPAILARAFARAALKHEASEKADKENEALGVMINIAGVVSERADTRSWTTLPNRVYIARLPLTAGRRTVRVELQERSGGVAAIREYTVDLAPGERRFISLHWVTPADIEPMSYRVERRHLR